MGLVLVVEDHNETRYGVIRLLEHWGHQAIGCETGEAALDLLVNHCPDLMIVDFMMPGMSGAEFIRLVRSNPERAFIPAVLYTNVADQSFARDAIGDNELWVKTKMEFVDMRERIEHFVNGDGKPAGP